MIRLLLCLCIPITFAQIDLQQLIGLKHLQEGGIHRYLAYKQFHQGLLVGNQRSSQGENQLSGLGNSQQSSVRVHQQSALGNNQQSPLGGNQQFVRNNQQSPLGGNQRSGVGVKQQSSIGVRNQQSSFVRNQQPTTGGNQQSFLGEVIQSLTGGTKQTPVGVNQQASTGNNQQSSIGNSQQASIGSIQQPLLGRSQQSLFGSNQQSSIGTNQQSSNGIDFRKLLALKQLPRRCRYPAYPGFNSENPFARYQMYYYNAESGRCESFNYSGRGGNRNRFRTPVQCLKSCACHAPMDAGTCTQSSTTTRFFYNKRFRMCTQFQFNGCDGNDNNFSDYMSCQISCRGLDIEM